MGSLQTAGCSPVPGRSIAILNECLHKKGIVDLPVCVRAVVQICAKNKNFGRGNAEKQKIHGSRFPSRLAACVPLINSDNPKGQTGAEARKCIASVGRLKPPSSTVVPAFSRARNPQPSEAYANSKIAPSYVRPTRPPACCPREHTQPAEHRGCSAGHEQFRSYRSACRQSL